jgi:hypothetical protein
MGRFLIFFLLRVTDSSKDITPINNISEDPGLVKRHNEILKLLRTVTRAVIEKSKFDVIYPDKKSFRIDWQGFYGDLLRCLLYDAFRRYTIWFHKNDPKPGVGGSRKRTNEVLYPDSDLDDDEAEDTDAKPKIKKVKKDQRCRFCLSFLYHPADEPLKNCLTRQFWPNLSR